MSDSTYLRNVAKQKQQKHTINLESKWTKWCHPHFCLPTSQQRLVFLSHGISSSQRVRVFVWRWTAEVARLPKIEAPAWLKGSEFVTYSLICLRITMEAKHHLGPNNEVLLHCFFQVCSFSTGAKNPMFLCCPPTTCIKLTPTANLMGVSKRSFPAKIFALAKRWWQLGVWDPSGQ